MKLKNVFLATILILSFYTYAQSLNSFEVIVIPAKFDFQKEANQYGTQSLIEAYFKQKGFNVVIQAQTVPQAINNEFCKAIYVSIDEKSTMFNTKIIVFLKDCNGKILAQSSEGISREKQYDMIYKQAVRAALTTLPEFNYKYDPTQKTAEAKFINEFKNSLDKKTIETTKSREANNGSATVDYQIENLSNGYLLIEKTTQNVFVKLFKTANPKIFIAKLGTQPGVATIQNDVLTIEYVADNVVKVLQVNVKL